MITLENETDIVVSTLPNGIAWRRKYAPQKDQKESNLRKLIRGVAKTFHRMRQYIENVKTQLNIFTTTELLEEYELLLNSNNGEVLPIANNIPDRIRNVLRKYTVCRVQSLTELQNAIKSIFGVNCVVASALDDRFTYKFPIRLWATKFTRSKIIYIRLPKSILGPTFPYTFPIQFYKSDKDIIEKLIQWIAPIDKHIIFDYVL